MDSKRDRIFLRADRLFERMSYYSAMPGFVKDSIRKISLHLPVSHNYLSADYKVKQFLKGDGVSPEIRFFLWRGAFSVAEKEKLLNPDIRRELGRHNCYNDIDRYVQESGLTNSLERLLYLSMMDRLDRSYHDGHMQLDLNGDLIGGPKQGEKASDYFKKQLRDGRIFVGFDCDDDGLGTAVTKGGRQSFLFGSDFPHEVFDAAKCRHEIDELLERDDLTQADKEAVLGGNAMKFYRPAL